MHLVFLVTMTMSQRKKQYNLRSAMNETVKIPVQLQVPQEDSVSSKARAVKHQVSVYNSDESVKVAI